MPNRGWQDIVADMLELAKEPSRKTHLMYKGGFSYESLRKYWALTKTGGLLQHDKKTGKSQTTEKGLEYLRLFYALNKLAYWEGMFVLDLLKAKETTKMEIEEETSL